MPINVAELFQDNQRRNEILKTLVINDIKIIKACDGQAELSVEITESMLNVHEKIHGGVLFTIADSTAGACAVSLGKKSSYTKCQYKFHKSKSYRKSNF